MLLSPDSVVLVHKMSLLSLLSDIKLNDCFFNSTSYIGPTRIYVYIGLKNILSPLLSHIHVIPAKAGLNSIGLNLNSQRLAHRAEYMEVFCNPVSYRAYSFQ